MLTAVTSQVFAFLIGAIVGYYFAKTEVKP